nr:immunoglobulin heavy chain junction region [Mus musculus]
CAREEKWLRRYFDVW